MFFSKVMEGMDEALPTGDTLLHAVGSLHVRG